MRQDRQQQRNCEQRASRRVHPRAFVVLGLVALAGLPSACASGARPAAPGPVITVLPDTTMRGLVNPPGVRPVSGALRTLVALQYVDELVGMGPTVGERQCVYANYTGWLTDGSKFDSSRDTTPRGEPREPIVFPLGARRVIAGWDAGFAGMQVGGRRRLVIPHHLAYGESGSPPVIPPRATLLFDLELLAVRDTLRRDPEEPVRLGAPPRCAPWAEVAPAARPSTGPTL